MSPAFDLVRIHKFARPRVSGDEPSPNSDFGFTRNQAPRERG